jgi:hypothetical protein
MDKPSFSLNSANIVIIGLGLMGGSLALSLKERCRCLSALDSHSPTFDFAPHAKKRSTQGEYHDDYYAIGSNPGSG